jgi:hypothetical protein
MVNGNGTIGPDRWRFATAALLYGLDQLSPARRCVLLA